MTFGIFGINLRLIDSIIIFKKYVSYVDHLGLHKKTQLGKVVLHSINIPAFSLPSYTCHRGGLFDGERICLRNLVSKSSAKIQNNKYNIQNTSYHPEAEPRRIL